MVQLVFVHGVSVRNREDDTSYELGVEERHNHFLRWGFGGANQVSFKDPYWGQFGAPDKYKSLDFSNDVALATGIGPLGEAIGDTGETGAKTDLRDAAREDFPALVNSLSIALIDPENPDQDPAMAAALADYLVSLEGDSVTDEPEKPSWVDNPAIANDEQFLERLQKAIEPDGAASLSLKNKLKSAGSWLLRRGLRMIDGKLARKVRAISPAVTLFLGDAFIYLKPSTQSDERQNMIRETVAVDIAHAAKAAREGGEKLILVGHSMGANILYDMLTSPDVVTHIESRSGGPLKVDLILTVGTQMGLLEELKLFGSSRAERTGRRPATCEKWWHVYNRMDVLSFGAKNVFEGVEQFHCDTNADIIDAHSAYFFSPVFYKRLYKRLKAGNLAI